MIKTKIPCPVCKTPLEMTDTVEFLELCCPNPKCSFAYGDYDKPKPTRPPLSLPPLRKNSWTKLREDYLKKQDWFRKLVR